MYHLGLFRDKVTLTPVECERPQCRSRCFVCSSIIPPEDYSKLPSKPPVDVVFVLDPLIATGGTACAALTMVLDWGLPGDISPADLSRSADKGDC